MLTTGHLSAIIQSSDDAIISKDLAGNVLSWNPAAERIFGFTEAEMIGQNIRRLIPAELHPEEDRILEQVWRGERVPSFETHRLNKLGELIRVAITVSPVHDEAGKVVAASKIARDITQRHATEQALRESEGRLRMLADNISQLAWIAQADGALIWYNKRWYDYTGTTFDEMAGWGWQSVHDPEKIEAVTARFQAAIAAGTDWEDTFPLRGADGTFRWFLSRAKPIRGDDGAIEFWFGSNTDITELLEKEQQIRVLMMEVNHRSKNMLTVVQALARRSAQHDPEFLARFEQRIGSLAANQDLLIRRGWSQIPVAELVEAQLAFLARETRAQIAVDGEPFDLSPRAAEIIGMALHELAINALKYGALSVRGGRIALRWWQPSPSRFAMEWIEAQGPPITSPQRPGFGTTLVRDIPARSLRGAVDLRFANDGLCWKLECDGAVVQELT